MITLLASAYQLVSPAPCIWECLVGQIRRMSGWCQEADTPECCTFMLHCRILWRELCSVCSLVMDYRSPGMLFRTYQLNSLVRCHGHLGGGGVRMWVQRLCYWDGCEHTQQQTILRNGTNFFLTSALSARECCCECRRWGCLQLLTGYHYIRELGCFHLVVIVTTWCRGADSYFRTWLSWRLHYMLVSGSTQLGHWRCGTQGRLNGLAADQWGVWTRLTDCVSLTIASV